MNRIAVVALVVVNTFASLACCCFPSVPQPGAKAVENGPVTMKPAGKPIVAKGTTKAERRAKAEAEAAAKNVANRKAYEAEVALRKKQFEADTKAHEATVARLTTQHQEALKKYPAELQEYREKVVPAYEKAKREYAASMKLRELGLEMAKAASARGRFAPTKEELKEETLFRYRQFELLHPDTQAEKDAQEDIEFIRKNGYAKVRPAPAKLMPPFPPDEPVLKLPPAPALVLPAPPEPVPVVYPPDPEEIAAAERAEAARQAAAEQARRDAEAAQRAEEEYETNGLVLLKKTLNGVVKDFGGEITGTVVNRRNETLSYAQITFNLYDETGAQVGSAIANINNLEAGGRWNFRAVTFSNRWRTFKCIGLSGL